MRTPGWLVVLGALAGCGTGDAGHDGSVWRDDGLFLPPPDLAVEEWGDLLLGDCADNAGGCRVVKAGPPLPLRGDAMPDPLEADHAVARDANGALVLDKPIQGGGRAVWLANSAAGTVSRIDPATVREVGRYPSVTCFSLKTGSTRQCDGTNGCCAIDDFQRYQARRSQQAQPGHQEVQLTGNHPLAIAVDPLGNAFVSNQAFGGGQSSVTRIAADRLDCVDRNHNGRIDTSSDVDGDGLITTDCNGDGQPDDIASVQNTPCLGRTKQEYFGADDECVLWTSNTFDVNMNGTALALDAAQRVWAASYASGAFVALDVDTGLATADTRVGNNPFMAAVDDKGILWSGPKGGPTLCYFDTAHPNNTACARTAQGFPVNGFGVALDPDGNVWLGGGVMRYWPDRSNGFANLGNGFWTKIQGANGYGIAVDRRSPSAYFAWVCLGDRVMQIPASEIPGPGQGGQAFADWQVQPNGWPEVVTNCAGVALDSSQNVWISDLKTTTRVLVDGNGVVTQPMINGPRQGGAQCPAGDSCAVDQAFAYSDFTGFGFASEVRVDGTWSTILVGCRDKDGQPALTEWRALWWDGDVPPGTTLQANAREGSSLSTTWRNPYASAVQPPLTLGYAPETYLQVEFRLASSDAGLTPTLRSVWAGYRCP